MVPQDTSDVAGPFGSKGCDLPLGGARALLDAIKDAQLFEFDAQPHIVFITGNVVSQQPGQLNLETHIDTMTDTYEMIKEVFD
jgi:hypothetical protein